MYTAVVLNELYIAAYLALPTQNVRSDVLFLKSIDVNKIYIYIYAHITY